MPSLGFFTWGRRLRLVQLTGCRQKYSSRLHWNGVGCAVLLSIVGYLWNIHSGTFDSRRTEQNNSAEYSAVKMGVPSLGYFCRKTAIANISQLTYVPEDLPIDTIMDILRCVPSAGLLKVVQGNSPHILQHDQIETLWERFAKKEFGFLLRAKIELHKKELGQDSDFPVVPWEEVYDTLAREECKSCSQTNFP